MKRSLRKDSPFIKVQLPNPGFGFPVRVSPQLFKKLESILTIIGLNEKKLKLKIQLLKTL